MNPKTQIFGYTVDAIRMHEAVATIFEWVDQASTVCEYVVTPNVDHTVMYQERADLRAAYADAGMVLADGMPVVIAARLLGKSVPERVPGSDLVYRIFDQATTRAVNTAGHIPQPELEPVGASVHDEHILASQIARKSPQATIARSNGPPKELSVYLLGAAEGVPDRAAEAIHARWPGVKVVGVYSPPKGFEHDPQENFQILRRVAVAQPDVLVVGLGAPKQELWVHAHRSEIKAKVTLCVGATIDFLAGEKPRAPIWMQRSGLEWLHRLASEPKRLARRYLRDAWIFPRLVWREYWSTMRAN